MNAVTDWPTIAETHVEVLPALQSLREHSLAELNAVERGLAKLRTEHGSTDYDITTPHGYRLATARRHAIRLVRYEVPRVVTAKRAELNEIRDAVKAEGDRIIAELRAIEDPHDRLITAEDERKAAEKADRERIEAERKAKHEAGIATICSYSERCAGLSSERIAAGIAQLEAIHITDSWEEFKERAELAKLSTLARMVSLRDAAKQREEEAARLEAQRIENARIAAEQAAERKRLAEAAAKVKAEAEALQRRINEQAEREAKAARLAAQQAEDARIAALAEQRRQDAAAESARIAQATAIPEGLDSQQVLKAEAETPDATDRDVPATSSPVGGPMGAAQPAAAGRTEDKPMYAPLRAAEAPKQPVAFAEPEPAGDVFETLAWHDATRLMPDGSAPVLAWNADGFTLAWWEDETREWIECDSGLDLDGVTHWAEPKGPASA